MGLIETLQVSESPIFNIVKFIPLDRKFVCSIII